MPLSGKSRDNLIGLVKPDLRLFMYLWPKIANNQRNRTVGTTDGVAREYGDYVYRNELDTNMCKDVYDDACECPQCMEGETVIDCTCVPSTSFNQVGDTIVGNLQKFGWVVFRGLTLDPDTATDINKMATKGSGKFGRWECIESSQKNHKMKYAINSHIPKEWKEDYLAKFYRI